MEQSKLDEMTKLAFDLTEVMEGVLVRLPKDHEDVALLNEWVTRGYDATDNLAEEFYKRATPMYMHLFHGRSHPGQDMEDWGTEGPVLRIEGFHVTYGGFRVCEPGGDWVDLTLVEDLLYYDGMYYGDWSIFTGWSDIELSRRAEDYDEAKSVRPTN